jgi:hypothetical protein
LWSQAKSRSIFQRRFARRNGRRAEGRFEHGPLDVGEVHAVEYDGDPTDVSR